MIEIEKKIELHLCIDDHDPIILLETGATVLIERDFETHGHDNNSANSVTMGDDGQEILRLFDIKLDHRGGVKIKDSELVLEVERTVEQEIEEGDYDDQPEN
tara:strand:+ start:1288 stop:1593 length:306 start_codon:yes stop_codon:yes gene_type:complete